MVIDDKIELYSTPHRILQDNPNQFLTSNSIKDVSRETVRNKNNYNLWKKWYNDNTKGIEFKMKGFYLNFPKLT